MAVKQEKDLDERLRGYWLKAVAAIELRNFGYAIALLQNLLKQEPEFLTGRQILRRAEVTRAKTEKKGLFNISTAPLAIMKAQRELKKDPRRTIELAEKVLASGPYNPQANMLLKDAAVAAEYPEIAIFAMETLLENEPGDLKVLHELGRLYDQYDRSDKAVEVYNRIAEINPLDLDAVKLGKDASARASMQKGGWAEAQSYRDLIKDKEVAISLEQQTRMQLSDESLEQQINEVFAQHEAAPQNIDLAKRLGHLHDQKEDLEGAVAWYQYAVDLTGRSDPGLVRKVADMKMRQLDHQIRDDEKYLAEHGPHDPQFAAKSAALETARKQHAEILIDDARKRLDRNPTDLQLRYELGEHLTNAGQYREALPELQRARQNPNARLKAMNLVGRCYRELGMLDLAAKQLDDAAREMLAMDAMKKEILYNLGLVYEQMGNAEKYIEAMKKIYEADYGYRDVARRVESSYSRAPEAS
ncbi:MAG TPA: tetratricopeptide repeat protein [Chthoniobacterales bacterium]|jgi:tetratricopeptide (TPR) repeat protein|nr:tetratricopeptide repeat protein [Chthoniobacterales bacterium]